MEMESATPPVELEFEQACAEARSHVSVVRSELKGRSLFTHEPFEKGDEILLEYPLREVSASSQGPLFQNLLGLVEQDRDKAIMYWGAYHSLCIRDVDNNAAKEKNGCECCDQQYVSEQQQQMILALHHHPSEVELTERIAAVLLIPTRSISLFHELFEVWCGNSFDCDANVGYSGVIYFLPAMSSHSCRPNCCWSFGSENSYVLRARRDIDEDEELTISYLSPQQLKWPTPERRQFLLDTKGFKCECERCNTVDTMRTFTCSQCSEARATLVGEMLRCPCGLITENGEALGREEYAIAHPQQAEDILGNRHYLAERSWGSDNVHDLEKRVAFLRDHDLFSAGEAPEVLIALGDLRASEKSPEFDVEKATAHYEEAAVIWGQLLGTDHYLHHVARRKAEALEHALSCLGPTLHHAEKIVKGRKLRRDAKSDSRSRQKNRG